MKQRIHHFNLIEIVLAIAVVGFGVVVILGMLPKGLRATQNAGIESYSSEIISQMGNYLQLEGADGITTWEDNIVWDLSSMDNAVRADCATLLKQMDYTQVYDGPDDYERTNMLGVFHRKSTGNMGTIYVVVMGNTFTDDGAVETKTDFTGLLRVWKKQRKYQQLRVNHQSTALEHNCIDEGCYDQFKPPQEVPDDNGATVCMELSYPLSLPYKERTKRYYSFDVEEQE